MKSMSGQKKSMGKKWFSHVLKTAKRSYRKGRRGGADEPEEPVKEEMRMDDASGPVVGEPPAGEGEKDMGGRRRRRGSKKTQRRGGRKH